MLTTNAVARIGRVRFRPSDNNFRIHRNNGRTSWATYRAGLAADTSLVVVNETTQEWFVASFPAASVADQFTLTATAATWVAGDSLSAPFLAASITGYDGTGNFGEALQAMCDRFEDSTVVVAVLPVNTYRPAFS